MRRRDFIKVLGGGVAAWPLSARAQRTAMPVIGYLAAGAPNSEARLHDAFVKGLGESGYEIGKNARIEYRWAENQYDRLPSMAADLVRQEVAVLAATTTPAARAAKAATGTIPIVFTTIADPVQIGFVTSLNRPGGNVTGATMLSVEVGPKLVELLHAFTDRAREPIRRTSARGLRTDAFDVHVYSFVDAPGLRPKLPECPYLTQADIAN